MHKNSIFILIFIIAGLAFLARAWLIGSAVWGDGRFYYQYLPSLVNNHDLGPPNKYAIGPALFWLPVFGLAHLFVRQTGYEFIYQVIVGLFSVFLGSVGLYVCFLTAKKFFPGKIALIATVTIWLGSNLFFYTVLDPVNSHALSFFVASLMVYCLLRGKTPYLGLLVGISGTIRAQDLIFCLPIAFILRKPRTVFNFLLGVIIGFLPQLLVWKIISGQINSPYLMGGEKFNLLKPQIFNVLFSRSNGLFYYSPVLLFGLLGLFVTLRVSRRAGLLGIILFVLQTYIISSWHDWSGGQAYGGRMFISLIPFFILGLAGGLKKLPRIKIITGIIIICFICLNFCSMVKFLIINP
jgi:hypothetical protein